MTASQDILSTAPEAEPAPAAGEVPPAEAGTGEEDKRKRRKALLLLFLLALLAILLGLAIWYLLFRQPVPLPPIPVTQVPHYTTSFYGVDHPVGVAATANGDRIYVTQSGSANVATVLDSSGNKVADMLPPVSTGAEHAPVYPAVDPTNGEVYVSDRPTGTIYIYDGNGAYQREFKPVVARPGWQPLGMAFDAAGNLYVLDLGAAPPQVVEFDRSGNVIQQIGAAEAMDFPNGVAVDGNGYIYVTDSNNGRLLVYDKDGKLAATIGRGAGEGKLGLPRGLALDSVGHVLVMDTSGQAGFVYKQLQPGQNQLEYVGTFGEQGVANGQFLYPNGLGVDGRGRIYVADTANDRIQQWSY